MKNGIHKFLKFLCVPLCIGVHNPCFKFGKVQRQNTQYANDKLNYVRMCKKCAKENYLNWQDRWDDLHEKADK